MRVWAVEDDWDVADLKSNMFELDWPPRSGRSQKFAELDRAAWVDVKEAWTKILKGQAISVCWPRSRRLKSFTDVHS